MKNHKLSAQEKKQDRKLAIVGLFFVLLIGALSLALWPYFSKLSDPVYQEPLRAWINKLGFAGWLAVLGVQMLQIIIAFVPGEPVEILAGVLYGSFGGLLTCLLGIVLSSSLVFFTARKFGHSLVSKIFGRDKLEEFSFINNTEKVEITTFVLFLIPGTPKDMLTYIAGITKIKPSQFLLISTFARIPSVITSTLMGDTLSRGNWALTIVIFLITAAIGLVGILYKSKIIGRLKKNKS